MRTAAVHLRPAWLTITLTVLIVGGCSQMGGGTYLLELHNRTAVPIQLTASSWAGGDTVIASCESAKFVWGRGPVSGTGSEPPPEPPVDAVTIEIPTSLSPPADPSNSVTQTLIVSTEGVFGYPHGSTLPSLPPCEGRPPGE